MTRDEHLAYRAAMAAASAYTPAERRELIAARKARDDTKVAFDAAFGAHVRDRSSEAATYELEQADQAHERAVQACNRVALSIDRARKIRQAVVGREWQQACDDRLRESLASRAAPRKFTIAGDAVERHMRIGARLV